jgi:hypothetical protein
MADYDGRVSLWTVPSGNFIKELGRFETATTKSPPKVAVTPDDRVIILGDYSDSRIVIQPLKP